MKTITIKTLVFAACFFGATAVLAQSANGTVLTNEVQPFRISDHVNRATQQSVAAEQSLLSQNSITVAEGERPVSEFAVAEVSEPLGDAARRLKQEHAGAKKATAVWSKQ
jgi:hypothetical protein